MNPRDRKRQDTRLRFSIRGTVIWGSVIGVTDPTRTGDSVTLGVKDDRLPTGNLLPPPARRDNWTAQLRERPLLLVPQQDVGVPVYR